MAVVTQIVNADQTQPRVVSLTPTPLISSILPTLGVGDILSFLVQSTDSQGQGTLNLQGQSLLAYLPPEVRAGDRIAAQVTSLGDQVILKLLDSTRQGTISVDGRDRTVNSQGQPGQTTTRFAPAAYPVTPEFTKVIEELTRLLDKVSTLTSSVQQQTQLLPEKLPAPALETLIRNLSGLTVPSDSEVAAPQQIADQLKAFASATPNQNIKEVVETLRRLIPPTALPAAAARFVTALKEELNALYSQLATDDAEAVFPKLDRVIHSVEREIRDVRPQAVADKESLRQVLITLKQSSASSEDLKLQLREAINLLPKFESPQLSRETMRPEVMQQFRELVQVFDQMVARQELLGQLNPLMQALGEPAMILFPLLFSNFLAQGEMVVHSKNDQKQRKKSEEESKKGKGQGSFQRVQVSVPMPALGRVDIDLAHRPGEVLLRLMVEESDVGAFLLDQLQHLTTVLRENGFEKAEVVASVGPGNFETPEWVIALEPRTSVIA